MGNQRLKMAEGSPLWPAWDMVETKEDVHLTIDIPGMTTDAFELVFDGQTLRIFGERQRYARPEPHTLVMADRFAGPTVCCVGDWREGGGGGGIAVFCRSDPPTLS